MHHHWLQGCRHKLIAANGDGCRRKFLELLPEQGPLLSLMERCMGRLLLDLVQEEVPLQIIPSLRMLLQELLLVPRRYWMALRKANSAVVTADATRAQHRCICSHIPVSKDPILRVVKIG
jgi:hypothetical protein